MRTTVSQVQLGVEYSHKAAESLSLIRDASTRTSERIQEIAMAMKNQLEEADRIASEVNDIARMTEESSTAMRQTLDASEHLQSLAEGLDKQVHQFKV
jgi:methyl-accepting chemotaxis protein